MTPKRFFAVLGVVVVLSLAADGYFFYRAASSFNAKKTQLGHLLADIQVAQSQSDQLHQIERSYNSDIKPHYPALKAALPNAKNETDINKQLNTLASQAGVKIDTGPTYPDVTTPGPTSQTTSGPGGSLALAVGFTTSGSYSGQQLFLQGLENFPRECNVDNINVSETGGKVSIVFSVNFYLKL